MKIADARLLAQSWMLSLRAERKSPQTLKNYGDGVRFYLDWCEAQDREPLVRDTLRTWTAELVEAGMAPTTIRARQLPVRRFAAWLADEFEIPGDPFVGIKSPRLDAKVVEPLTDDELKALIKACAPPTGATPLEALRHRRDEAIVRLMLETGTRAGEVVAMTLDDVDLETGVATIRRGKGGKGRIVPLGPQVSQSIDRYLRLRRHHRLGATSPALWLGDRGKTFSYDGLHKTLGERAAAAGLTGFHPHKMRHTAAHRWLSKGGSETGLMAIAGWTRPDMLMRYTRAQASRRAADEARRLNLGEL